jgi:hypothetical protein
MNFPRVSPAQAITLGSRTTLEGDFSKRTWESPVKMDVYRENIMGISWENCGNMWKYYGKTWKNVGKSWEHIGKYGKLNDLLGGEHPGKHVFVP